MADSSLLLEEIAQKTGCNFLSDLHQAGMESEILKAIEKIPCNLYTLASWKDAAIYITAQECPFQNESEIRGYLAEYCKRQQELRSDG